MGTWGTGIFDDDIALDVQDCWEEQLAKGATPEQATSTVVNRLGDDYCEPDDASVFWIALAALQVEAKAVEPHVSDLVRREFAPNLASWKERGASDEDLAERAEVLRLLESSLLGGVALIALLVVMLLPDRLWDRVTGSDKLAAELGALHAEGLGLRNEMPWVRDGADAPLDAWEPRADEWLQRVHARLDGTPWQSMLLAPTNAFRVRPQNYDRASGLRFAIDDKLHQLSRIISSASRQ